MDGLTGEVPRARDARYLRDDPLLAALERAIGFQYEILRLLGRGGMGAVYHAHERALDRQVAIKVLPPDVATSSADARERFLREARTAARLTHPNIVPLLTFGEAEGLVYYVMGYVEGESLDQRLRRLGPFDADTATRILEQLAGALDYAHQQGIVHRDVKPENILLDASGTAKLTDFGIAKRAAAGETLTGPGLFLGTPRYMSPEQASGDRDLDARSDIYSLGLVGYAMLTGRPPFDGGSVQEILAQQVTRDAPSLRKLLPELPSGTAGAIERALQKDPARRWDSAGAMAAVLKDSEDDADLSRPSMRRPGAYALTTGAIAVVALNVASFVTLGTTHWLFLAVLAAIPLQVLPDYVSMRWREKLPRAEIRRILTEPPQWWPFWWPARWRRRDDVWKRLPRVLRFTRAATSLGLASFAVAMELVALGLSMPEARGGGLKGLLIGIGGVGFLPLSLLGFTGALAGVARFARKHGLSLEEANRISSVPTCRVRFWKQPAIARFLSGGEEAAAAEPASPGGMVDAIAAIVQQLPAPQREAVGSAVDASRALAAAIDALDDEAAILARDAEPAEIERLASKVATLGPVSPADSPAQREMRQLYTSQLELLRRLARQAQELGVRRRRYAELLRTLWLQLSTLRADHAADVLGSDDVSGRIRHIVRSVEHEVQGAREVRALEARDS